MDEAGTSRRSALARPETAGSPSGGFQGLPLVDLLQVWSLNRFSGMVRVTARGRAGNLYFVDGEIVHAEAEGLSGEPAVRAVVTWADVACEPFPNTSTLKRTIQKRMSHLLLDAARDLDERRHHGDPTRPAATPVPAPPREGHRPSVFDQIRAIRGVTGLVRFGSDGLPAGGEGSDAEALAAKGLYVALNHAATVAQAFGLTDLAMATVGGGSESFAVVHVQGRYLAVGIEAGQPVEPIAAQIRAALSRPAAR